MRLHRARLDRPAAPQALATRVDLAQPVIVRLDGHRFSRFTAGFHKPYDSRIFEAMLRTTADLLTQMNPDSAYTQSDEITLMYCNAERAPPFNGKVQKLASLAAAMCSVRFGCVPSRVRCDAVCGA